jgi:hypothetical protein
MCAGAGLVQKLLADLREVDASAVTAEQLGTDLILDITDAPADRRLLDAEVLSGRVPGGGVGGPEPGARSEAAG